jgi:pimeloyl-ACP methyl ester carboxylesterase
MSYLFFNRSLQRPIVAILVGVLFLGLSSCKLNHIVEMPQREIHEYKRIKIGGMRQAVMVRGTDINNPVMVFLHGGPGFPLFPFAPMGETMRRLEEEYTMIYWEQRGTGRSFSRRIPPESMTVEQFVEDTRQIIEFALEYTGQDKAFVWGHSWGSGIGALFASRYPEMVHAYVSTGQSVHPFRNERLSYEFVLERATEENNRRALRQLGRIDTIPEQYTLSDALTIRRWVYHYGGIVVEGAEERPYVDLREIQATLTSPFYTLNDRLNMILFPYYSAEMLWEDLKTLNLKEKAPKIDVPVFFLVGRHDVIVSALLAEEYFEMLEAPAGKTLIWFENSAHRPHTEEREKFLNILKQRVITEAFPEEYWETTWLEQEQGAPVINEDSD